MASLDSPPTSSTPPTPNPLKRKEPSNDRDQRSYTPTNALPAGANVPQGEYETGRVICEVCGGGVSFRDEATGGFTLKHWDAHRLTCVASGPASGEPVIYTPESTAEALANPPAKRRRAKRTEEERIEYLRADPYVAQFEAYRVLCASCDKWIRLRPNSTYCSIPWDAHRKSCLAKKINSKNVYALEERNTLFAKDPDVRKFDAERVLCNMCDKWLSINPDDHLEAVQKWLQHRASCQKVASGIKASLNTVHSAHSAPSVSERPNTASSASSVHRVPPPATSPVSPAPPPPNAHHHHHSHAHQQQRHAHNESPSSFHDLNPANYAPAHESRRRNAEQRAATLRADHLIGEVEPNRVFCSLCQKWVQLRQDSSYCAYPWLQHRGKCLARHQRRAQKAAEIAEMKAKKHVAALEEDELMSCSDGAGGSEDPESEEGVDDSHTEDSSLRVRHQVLPRRMEHHHHFVDQRIAAAAHFKTRPVTIGGGGTHSAQGRHGQQHMGGVRGRGSGREEARFGRTWGDGDVDADADADAEGDAYMDEDQQQPSRAAHRPAATHRGLLKRHWPVGLADLDSPAGRRSFIFGSVDYLFATTYESSDDMSISALLTYLNAAMPLDKHEDFDTSEVIKAAVALQEKGRIAFEGDMLRLVG